MNEEDEVDVLKTRDLKFYQFFTTIEGVYLMDEVGSFVMKFDRYTAVSPETIERDRADLIILLHIIEKNGRTEELEKFLYDNDYDELFEEKLNELILMYNKKFHQNIQPMQT